MSLPRSTSLSSEPNFKTKARPISPVLGVQVELEKLFEEKRRGLIHRISEFRNLLDIRKSPEVCLDLLQVGDRLSAPRKPIFVVSADFAGMRSGDGIH